MAIPRLRSPLARGIVPVLGGIAFFAMFFAGLWLIATVINGRADVGSEIGNRVFEVGEVSAMAKAITAEGPLLLPDLHSPDGIRSIVLDHVGKDPGTGWQVYYGYPADRDSRCLVTHIQGTRTFVDCEKRTIQVNQLKAPSEVRPIVENKKTLFIDLRGLTASASTLP